MKTKLFLFAILIIILFNGELNAHDDEIIHPRITRQAALEANLDSYFISELDLRNAWGTIMTMNRSNTILKYLEDGSKFEDSPKCRAASHFHDPLKSWNVSYMTDRNPYVDFRCQFSEFTQIYSNITWGTGFWSPDAPRIERVAQRMGWDHAQKYFYLALTAASKTDREQYYALTFQALGQVLHLLEDLTVPAHVRNDFTSHYNHRFLPESIPDPKWNINLFEYYVKNNPGLIPAAEPQFPSFPNPFRVTDFWDRNLYDGSTPLQGLDLGLAELVNANYLSDWTITNNKPTDKHFFEFPQINHNTTQICEYLAPDSNIKRKYISRKVGGGWCPLPSEGGKVDHFATPSLLNDENSITDGNISNLRLWLDDNVHDTYARELLPPAIGYSAGLLQYFFRGRLDVTSVPIFYNKRLFCPWLTIKNATPKEDMVGGHFVLTYRYTPEGGNSDGSNDIFGQAWASAKSIFAEVDTLESGDEEGQDFEFFMSGEGIPVESLASLRFTLAYQGRLGLEEGAVIGKVFTPGEIKFNEEWDKGLTGNHTWLHTGDSGYDNNDPEVGLKVNRIDGDTLVKENIRYRGQGRRHYNDSFIGISSASPGDPYGEGFPIAVTPNTYLQFKIDQLSMDPPFPRTIDSCADQFLELRFDHGLILQYTQPGQYGCIGSGYGVTVAYYGFDLGYVNVTNIYKDLREAGMPIPEGGLFLRYISLYQQIWGSYYPSAGKHKQRMEMDFIRIVEGKESLAPKE